MLSEERKESKHEMRYHNLRVRNGCISPCVICFSHEAKNVMTVNGLELQKASEYWYDIRGCNLKLHDRIEISAIHIKSGEPFKIVTLEITGLTKKSIRLLELARDDLRKKNLTLSLKESEVLYKEDNPGDLDHCPTCDRPL